MPILPLLAPFANNDDPLATASNTRAAGSWVLAPFVGVGVVDAVLAGSWATVAVAVGGGAGAEGLGVAARAAVVSVH